MSKPIVTESEIVLRLGTVAVRAVCPVHRAVLEPCGEACGFMLVQCPERYCPLRMYLCPRTHGTKACVRYYGHAGECVSRSGRLAQGTGGDGVRERPAISTDIPWLRDPAASGWRWRAFVGEWELLAYDDGRWWVNGRHPYTHASGVERAFEVAKARCVLVMEAMVGA